MLILYLILICAYSNDQECSLNDFRQANLDEGDLQQKHERFYRYRTGYDYHIENSFFYSLYSDNDGSAVFVISDETLLRIYRSLFGRCISTNFGGGAICFYGPKLLLQQSFGMLCENHNEDHSRYGDFIDSTFFSSFISNDRYTRMIQTTILQCPPKRSIRSYSYGSCFFNLGEDEINFEVSQCNFSDNQDNSYGPAFSMQNGIDHMIKYNNFQNLLAVISIDFDGDGHIFQIYYGLNYIFQDCNFINCSVGDLGSFISIYLRNDENHITLKKLYFVNCQGKYLLSTYSYSIDVSIEDSIYIFNFSFDTVDYNWGSFLNYLSEPLTLNLKDKLKPPFNAEKIIEIFSSDYSLNCDDIRTDYLSFSTQDLENSFLSLSDTISKSKIISQDVSESEIISQEMSKPEMISQDVSNSSDIFTNLSFSDDLSASIKSNEEFVPQPENSSSNLLITILVFIIFLFCVVVAFISFIVYFYFFRKTKIVQETEVVQEQI